MSILTTGGPPPSGYYWIAAVFKSVDVAVEIKFLQLRIPNATVNIGVTPVFTMVGPEKFTLPFTLDVGQGNTSTTDGGTFNLSVSPRMTTVPSTATHLSVQPQVAVTMVGKRFHGSMSISVTPSLTFKGKAQPRGTQLGVSIKRASLY